MHNASKQIDPSNSKHVSIYEQFISDVVDSSSILF